MNRTPEMQLGDQQQPTEFCPELSKPLGLESAFYTWAAKHAPLIGASGPAAFSAQDVKNYAHRAFYAGSVTRCPDLNAIYGADIYTRGALEVQGSTIAGLKESLARAHRNTKRYAALALLGWIAVVVMGVAL